MYLEQLMKFAADMRTHLGLACSVKRCGNRLLMKIGNVEFLFDSEGKYLGHGGATKRELEDLVEGCDHEVMQSKLNRA